jgi:hypothetical protein
MGTDKTKLDGEWLFIDGQRYNLTPSPEVVRDELEWTIVDEIYSARKYHSSPDECLDRALEVISVLLEQFDRSVAMAYLQGREDECEALDKDHKEALFRMRCQAFNQGFDCALKYFEEGVE